MAIFISFGREFHKMLPRKDRLSLPWVLEDNQGKTRRKEFFIKLKEIGD